MGSDVMLWYLVDYRLQAVTLQSTALYVCYIPMILRLSINSCGLSFFQDWHYCKVIYMYMTVKMYMSVSRRVDFKTPRNSFSGSVYQKSENLLEPIQCFKLSEISLFETLFPLACIFIDRICIETELEQNRRFLEFRIPTLDVSSFFLNLNNF